MKLLNKEKKQVTIEQEIYTVEFDKFDLARIVTCLEDYEDDESVELYDKLHAILEGKK